MKKCTESHNIDINKLDEYGSGACMVLDCENEADYYIDFEDGEVQGIEL